MKSHNKISHNKKPKINGKGKLTVRVSKTDKDEYTATGYFGPKGRLREIGTITACTMPSCNYLTVRNASLEYRHTGKGYGHILYWALAKKAKSIGLKGLRSFCYGRNNYSDGAWRKIKTHSRNDYSYIRFD